jgi:Meckel syndrome type 1 protein
MVVTRGLFSEDIMAIRRSIIIAASLVAFVSSADGVLASASATTKECSDQWAKMKADNNVPSGMTWPKFLSQCSKDDAASSDQPAATPAKKVARASATKVATKRDTIDESDSNSSAADKKACDDKWGTYKASKGVHGWKAYFTFMAGCM